MSADVQAEAKPVVPTLPSDLKPLGDDLQASMFKAYPFSVGMDEEDIKARIDKILWIKEHLMTEGIHYGTTPGCKKPSLYQPGAQLLNIIFQHAPSYQHQVQRLDADKEGRRDFLCNLSCTLTHFPTGLVVGAGVGGSCTAEARWAKKPVFDSYNAALKMGAKRAYVAATVSCVGVSEIWTQDTEDNPDLYRDEDSQQPPARRPEPPRSQQQQRNGNNGNHRPSGKLERVEGFISRVWENDYQDKHYWFARLDKGQQLQTTDADLGDQLAKYQTGPAEAEHPNADRIAKRAAAKARHEAKPEPAQVRIPEDDEIPMDAFYEATP